MSSSATKPILSRSRPTTPLRASSHSSFRSSRNPHHAASTTKDSAPLEQFEPQFAELSDSMASLEENLIDLQLMHESLARFSESFASFLYGLNMNAYCVDFPEAPIPESFKRARSQDDSSQLQSLVSEPTQNTHGNMAADNETTFMSTETEFVENPPASSRSTVSKLKGRGRAAGIPVPRGAFTSRGGSRLPSARGRGRGVR